MKVMLLRPNALVPQEPPHTLVLVAHGPRGKGVVHVVVRPGTVLDGWITSPALHERRAPYLIYLPPGYTDPANAARHYPALYLLHGAPGQPSDWTDGAHVTILADEFIAQGQIRPLIMVMPFGSTGTFTDKEWVDGVGQGEDWATFVSHDLVQAIDARYRTIPTPAARAIAGLSEGGYGAINIALHNPDEFSVVESWSGYERAAHISSIFGRNLEGVPANSPLDTLAEVAPGLRRAHVYFWFYSGDDDPLRVQNREFANELKQLHIPHRYLVFRGGHNWALWRGQAQRELLTLETRLHA